MTTIHLGDIPIEIRYKKIKNIYLNVYPPSGTVRLSAPNTVDKETLRAFAASKLEWIRKQQKKLREQERESRREYRDRESHYHQGERYLLKVQEQNSAQGVELCHGTMVLKVRPGASTEQRRNVLESWQRRVMRALLPALLDKWEPKIGVSVDEARIRHMRTLWGSCTPERRSIRLNLDLIRKPPICLEYVLVHELIHFLEPSHNQNFVRLMERHMPQWRSYRDELNRLPIRHAEWDY